MFSQTRIIHGLLRLFLILNSAILLIPDKLKGIAVIGLLASSIYYYMHERFQKKFKYKLFLISISFFAMLLLSIIYSQDMDYALKKLETSLSLFAYPLVFVLLYNCKNSIDRKFMDILKWVFVASLSFFLIGTFTYYFLTEPFYTFKSTIVHYHTLIDVRIKGYEIHSIYLSMYIGVGIIFLVDLISRTIGLKKIIQIVLLVLLFVFLAILNKKGPIISLAIVGIIFLAKSKFKGKMAWSILALSFIFVATFISIPKFNNVNRFKELIDFNGLRANPNSSTAIRLSIYNCALKQAAIAPIFGYGWGDVKGVLIECYEKDSPNLLLKNYNTHNQFLSMLLATGIVGLIIFIFYFYYILKFSHKKRNPALFFLLLYFGFNMLSENILEREDGVIFYSFFVNLLLFNSGNNLEQKTRK